MTRCPECGAVLDSMTELARQECEPTCPTAEEVKRVRTNLRKREDAENYARTVKRACNDYEGM